MKLIRKDCHNLARQQLHDARAVASVCFGGKNEWPVDIARGKGKGKSGREREREECAPTNQLSQQPQQ